MKKAMILMLCIVVCALLTLSVTAATEAPAACQVCDVQQNWTVMPGSFAALTEGHYHYYLNQNMTPDQLIVPENVTICLDLNGNSIQTDGRAISIGANAVLNLMDSITGETGYVCGSTGANNAAGGTITVENGGQLNLYSGTVKFQKDDEGLGLCRGVVELESGSQMQVFGGRVEGGQLVAGTLPDQGTGGAIYMAANSKLILSGGEITSGIVPEGSEGSCVYASSGTSKVILTGTARVEEICGTFLQENLTISGIYTGYARLRSVASAPPSIGTVVGTLVDADISNANLFCINAEGFAVKKSDNTLVLAKFVPTARQHMCAHCKDIALWTSYANGSGLLKQAGHHHLYLSEKYTGKQISPNADAEICLDLYGNDIYSDGRAFYVREKGKFHVMDTVGGSSVTATSSNSNPSGGMAAVYKSAVLDIYSGEYTAIQDGTGAGIGTAGAIYMTSSSTVNLYGGTIRGTDLVMSTSSLSNNGCGAAIYMSPKSSLNVFGGEILSGTLPEGGKGKCVYVDATTAKVNVYGNGTVEELYCLTNSKHLTVYGVYTGTAGILFADNITVRENMEVGTCVDADISGANLQCLNGTGYSLINRDGALVTSSFSMNIVAAVYNPDKVTYYDSLQAAIDACTGGYVKLLKTTQQTATAEKDLYIDTNGYSAAVTLSEGVTLYGFDSQTDDYTVKDGKYGKLTVTGGTVKGLPEESEFAQDNYLAVTEDGKVSFHRVTLQIYAMSLRAAKAGIYYKSYFLGDEVAAQKIATFGVALSAWETPNSANMQTHCKYSVFTGFESGANGNPDTVSSTLLKGILKPTNAEPFNWSNLNTKVYGRAYAKTSDGEVLFGQPVERSLREQLELADESLKKLTTEQVDEMIALYQTYEAALKDLQLENLRRIMDDSQAFASAQIVEDGKTDYVIVHDGTDGAKKLADQLVKIFSDVYKIKLQSFYAEDREETDKEIVVGMARVSAHKAARKLTGEFDFAMTLTEDKLLLCGKNDLSYGYLGQYLKREVLVSGTALTLDSDDDMVYSQSVLMDTTYVDYWRAGNTSFSLQDHFAYREYKNEDTTLPYRLYVPFNYTPEKEYPLLINLHGAGRRGTDNRLQLAYLDKAMLNPNLNVDEAIIIFPQCSENNMWVDSDWSKGCYNLDDVPESNELRAVMEVLGQLRQAYSVDANRIYAIGCSMGGYGTWNLLMNHPDVFAAGVAMCGGGDPSKAHILKDKSIWAIHGAKDPTVPVSGSRDMAMALEAVGALDFHYTELPEAEHNVWTYTYENQEIFEWLFSRTK